jgi:4'-phosphopantetheinyl transferase EntD
VIDEILGHGAIATEVYDDTAGAMLLPEEERFVAVATDKRRREFTTVRHCARTSLARLGIPAVPLLPGERGEPQWPRGVVGSMTHCAGYAAAAVGPAARILAIGIDAEPHAPLPDEVLETISRSTERRAVATHSGAVPRIWWDRLLFSAKESVYKAWFPLTRRWLDFEQAEIVIERDTGAFSARVTAPGPVIEGRRLSEFAGRWLVRDGLVLTAIVVPVSRQRPPWP